MDWNLRYTKKNRKDNYIKNGAGEKIVGLSKLKLWPFVLGHGEHEWALVYTCRVSYRILLGRWKNWSYEAHCSWEVGGGGGESGGILSQERFSLWVASGGFWDPRRLVAGMLMHVEINLA